MLAVSESLRAHQQDGPSALSGVFAGDSTPPEPQTVCFFTAVAAEFAVTQAKSLLTTSAMLQHLDTTGLISLIFYGQPFIAVILCNQ